MIIMDGIREPRDGIVVDVIPGFVWGIAKSPSADAEGPSTFGMTPLNWQKMQAIF